MIRQEPLRTQFGVLFGWFKRNFSLENSNRGRKVSPEKLKSSHSRRFLLEKIEKFEKSKSSHSRRFLLEKSKNSKNSKSRKVEKFEKFKKSKSSHSRRFLLEKSKNSKNSKSRKVRKNSKSRKLFDFLRKVLQFSRCAITGEKSA